MTAPTFRKSRGCLFFALKEERVPAFQRTAESLFHSGITGVGMQKTAAQVELAIRLFRQDYGGAPPDFILVCGFGGGLEADLAPGSLIIADTVTDTTTHQAYRADSDLLAAAESVRVSGAFKRRGLLATTDRVLIRAGEKRAFAEQSGAIAVDMETAGAARIATEQRIPWLAVRGITDSVNEDLPFDFNALADAEGNVNRGRIVAAALLNPWKIPALLQLGQRSSLVARNLADFLIAFLDSLPE